MGSSFFYFDILYKLDKRAIALHLSKKLKRYQIPLTYKEVDKIQRTFNGKLDRKFYKRVK